MIEDTGSVEGLPLQLIITAIVLAITVPMMFGALRTYDITRTATEMDKLVEDIASRAQLVFVSGPGNSILLEISVPTPSFGNIEYLRLGDNPGGNFSSTIRYRMSSGGEVIHVIESPNVPVVSPSETFLDIMPGKYELMLKCITWPGDLNNDGLSPDTVVQASVSNT